MSTALTIRRDPFALANMGDAKDLSSQLSQSSLIPTAYRGKPADILVTIITGHELGLSPMQSLRAMHVVQGRPVMSAELMVALCKRHKDICKFFRLVESTAQKATYETLRDGDPEPTRLTYTFDEAKAAGLTGKDNWRNHAAAMLRARASSALARAVYPDLILGVMEEDEAREVQDRAPLREVRDERRDGAVVVQAVRTIEATDVYPEPETVANTDAPLREVDFPTSENDEREQLLAAEKLIREANKDELHKLVNEVMPGEEKKNARKAAYEGFGLRGRNPIATFLALSVGEQQAMLLKVRAWHSAHLSELPESWAGGGK